MSPHLDPSHPLAAEARSEVHILEEVWNDRPGFWGWLRSVDHKSIAKRYIVTAFTFFLLGGLTALLMRTQLARPENEVIGPDLYNQAFSVHGTTMMFLFAVPVMLAMGLYFVPLMVGTRNVAYPRLNALGYWTYLIGGLLLWVGFFLNTAPDTGWFSYVPLAGPEYTPGKRVDVWAQTVTFTEVSALISAVEIIATTFRQRAPRMSIDKIPLFVWALVVASFMVLFAMTTVATATMMLAFDRLVGTHFFNPAEGGDPLLWQHLFWFFGHPEVYIIFLPATGMVSAMLPAFTRRPVFGHTALVLSLIATGFLSFGLWVHHMFAIGVSHQALAFFTTASLMVAIPSIVQVFCWIGTLWTGRIVWRTPLLFILGFLFLFVAGGLTGVMIASIPFDWQAHDTYFIVAHFHYVLVGGSVFPLFAAIYYWFPKITGRMLSERLGVANFALFFIGTNLTFFPMHFLGLLGMPRRVYTYLEDTGWGDLNMLATVGAFTIALSALVFLVNVVTSLRSGVHAGDDPWGGDSLEWATSSPPPAYNFARIPVVEHREEMWHRGADAPYVVGMDEEKREVLVTTATDAHADSRHSQPGPTIAPLLSALAIGVLFVGLIFTPWAAVVGTVLMLPPLLLWGYPHEHHKKAEEVVR